MLNEIGGLAGGLANGLALGMQLKMQKGYLDLQNKYADRAVEQDKRDAEVHTARMEQYGAEKELRDRRRTALQQIADYTANAFGGGNQPAPAGPGAPVDPNAPSFNMPAPLQTPSQTISSPMQGGLGVPANMTAPAAQQPAQPAENPAKVLEKGMVTGMYTPKMLTDIAGIFAQNGLHEEGIKYMNTAYEAQKRGFVRASMSLLQNNPGEAASALQAGGMNLKGLPVKVKPDDPNDPNWKVNVEGQGEKTINVRDMLRSTMDPEEFFKEEDRQRKASLEERKQVNDDRETNARIGYLKSRSTLAEANADKADRSGMGGLASSRSSEAQIDKALARRDKTFDRVSSVKNDEGKFEVDPAKRQLLDSASNQYQDFLENQLGEELDARQHQKFTDAMATYPVGGTPDQIKKWQQAELLPRFGGRLAQSGSAAAQETRSAPSAQSFDPAPETPSGPPPGSLASLKQKAAERQAINQEMAGVQQALKNPNLNVEQRKALALKAQEIATRRDSLK